MHWFFRIGFSIGAWETMELFTSPLAGAVAVYGMALAWILLEWWCDNGRPAGFVHFWASQRDRAGHRAGFWLAVAVCGLISIATLAAVLSQFELPFLARFAAAIALGMLSIAIPLDRTSNSC